MIKSEAFCTQNTVEINIFIFLKNQLLRRIRFQKRCSYYFFKYIFCYTLHYNTLLRFNVGGLKSCYGMIEFEIVFLGFKLERVNETSF